VAAVLYGDQRNFLTTQRMVQPIANLCPLQVPAAVIRTNSGGRNARFRCWRKCERRGAWRCRMLSFNLYIAALLSGTGGTRRQQRCAFSYTVFRRNATGSSVFKKKKSTRNVGNSGILLSNRSAVTGASANGPVAPLVWVVPCTNLFIDHQRQGCVVQPHRNRCSMCMRASEFCTSGAAAQQHSRATATAAAPIYR